MDQQNPTLTKIPILDTGKFGQWQFRIQQYLQHEHYALYEVIEFGDSYEVPANATTTGTASDGTGKKREGHKHKTAQELWAAILKTFGGNEATKKTKKNLLKQQYGNFKAEGSETLEQMFNRLQSYMANDEENHALIADKETLTEFALMAKTSAESEVFDNSLCSKACNKNSDSLNSKITELTEKLCDAKNMIYHYKLVLAQVESRLAEHKSRELKYCEKIRVLEYKIESSTDCIENLKKELELIKKEKEGLDTKLTGFQTASKDLDSLLESQRLDKNKEGLGYSVVPPSPAQIYFPSKKDMSWTGLPECADDTVTDYSRPAPTIESFLDNAQNKNPSVTETEASPSTISPKPFIKFVKANTTLTKSKTGMVETAKKPPVKKFPTANRKFPTGSTKFSTADMGKKGKAGSSQNNIDDKGYWDSGCSRHMTGNISYLSDYEPFDGGYVSFGQGGCKITSKGTVKTTPRQHNMYSIDLNNIVSHKDLTCLVAKAFADEGMLWHRRLGHFNFKTINRIKKEFSNARTPQQNGVAERRNRTLIEAARTMLADAKLPVTFWAKAVNTACYVQNRVLVNKSHNKTPYELFNFRSPTIGFLKPFDCHVMILNTLDNLGKFEAKGDKGTNSTNLSGTKDAASQEVKKDVSSLRYIALPNWVHDALLETSSSKPQDNYSSDVPESSGNSNPTATSTNRSADHMETLTVETPIPTVSSPVLTACFTDSQEPSSDTRLISKRVANQVETPSLDNILTLTNRFKDILGVTTNLDESNGLEADVSNMETTIIASPTPTLRIHKDHPKSQIISLVDTPIQTKNKSKEPPGFQDPEFPARVYKVEKAMYALTFKPTVYVSHIRQFWSTARIETTKKGTKILATVDGIIITVTDSSLRRNIKLKDEEGISSLPDVELFENLTLMGYNISPNQKQYTRRARIAQSSALSPVADEPASPLRDASQGEACLTVSSLDAEQNRANIAKTSTFPHKSTSRVTSLAADEGAQELEINSLKARIKLLEDKDRRVAEHSRDDALIKGRRLDVGEEAAERWFYSYCWPPAAEVSTGSDVVPTAGPIFATATMVTPYTRRKGKETMVESKTQKKKKVQEQIDAQVARELEEQIGREDQRMSEQIARDAEIARIHVEEELQIMIDGLDKSNETVAKYLQEYHQFATKLPLERRIELISDLVRYQDNYAKVYKFQTQQRKPWSKMQKMDYYMAVIKSNLGWKVKDFRGMTFEEIKAKFTTVWKQIKNFIPMGSKEKAEKFKRKVIRFEQESLKKLKTSEEVPEEVKIPDEVPKEKVKEMMQLVPIKEVYVEALQVKHPIID
nr:ribonuclease H-like domain-containing protein [Tanacetum cinerariifolium]